MITLLLNSYNVIPQSYNTTIEVRDGMPLLLKRACKKHDKTAYENGLF